MTVHSLTSVFEATMGLDRDIDGLIQVMQSRSAQQCEPSVARRLRRGSRRRRG